MTTTTRRREKKTWRSFSGAPLSRLLTTILLWPRVDVVANAVDYAKFFEFTGNLDPSFYIGPLKWDD